MTEKQMLISWRMNNKIYLQVPESSILFEVTDWNVVKSKKV
jgi:hypothetical protein